MPRVDQEDTSIHGVKPSLRVYTSRIKMPIVAKAAVALDLHSPVSAPRAQRSLEFVTYLAISGSGYWTIGTEITRAPQIRAHGVLMPRVIQAQIELIKPIEVAVGITITWEYVPHPEDQHRWTRRALV